MVGNRVGGGGDLLGAEHETHVSEGSRVSRWDLMKHAQ